ncbi:MAG TPA: hypothetical protein VGN80_12680 [Devosiaceae bacterium]|jgi:hypothetical protein|nr:hypothetical protein [Devosiaceae bacterium]
MKTNRTVIAVAAVVLAIGSGAAQAGPTRVGPGHQNGGTAQLAIGKGPVKDTCTESIAADPDACDIDQLTQRCDDAGGGMSSLPGGGVDCDLGPE